MSDLNIASSNNSGTYSTIDIVPNIIAPAIA
jgi:hypothetical protein